MKTKDEIAAVNQRLWEEEVKKGCGFTIPWLDLDRDVLEKFVEGRLNPVPDRLLTEFPPHVFGGAEGKDVLCLASGGGQQSAMFGVLGARVTVVDLTEGQLAGDRKAAEHYGYDVRTIQADMRDLSCLDAESFDLVYQGPSMGYIPDVREVYREVARVLRKGGLYRADGENPAVQFVDWDGEGYRITRPYAERVGRRGEDGQGAFDFRHYLSDTFNGLLAAGFRIEEVCESPAHLQHDPDAVPGSWKHVQMHLPNCFAIVARKM
jgi:SAM-dependent methyltransferase